jgi:cytidylate kinase
MKHHSIVIEGPAGAGKGTVAKLLANKLSYLYIDTGAIYRGLAYYSLQTLGSVQDQDAVCKNIDQADLQYISSDQDHLQKYSVILSGQDISSFIRTQEVSAATSIVGGYPCAVSKVNTIIKKIVESHNVVVEGQAIIENLLPNPDTLIYLTASSEVRAQRRYKELLQKNPQITYQEVMESMIKRDMYDQTRKFNKMKINPGAIVIDSSDLSIDQVVDKILTAEASIEQYK